MSENPKISLSLPLGQVNLVLMALAKQPLETTIDAFLAIREQTENQIRALNAAAQEEKA